MATCTVSCCATPAGCGPRIGGRLSRQEDGQPGRACTVCTFHALNITKSAWQQSFQAIKHCRGPASKRCLRVCTDKAAPVECLAYRTQQANANACLSSCLRSRLGLDDVGVTCKLPGGATLGRKPTKVTTPSASGLSMHRLQADTHQGL